MKKANGGMFSTSVKGWLSAMQKAGRLKPGGKVVFINKNSGALTHATDTPPDQPAGGAPPTGTQTIPE